MRLPCVRVLQRSAALALVCAVAVTADVISFTGDVPTDFPVGPGVFVATDGTTDVFFPHGVVPSDPYSPVVNDPTGWNIFDVRCVLDTGS